MNIFAALKEFQDSFELSNRPSVDLPEIEGENEEFIHMMRNTALALRHLGEHETNTERGLRIKLLCEEMYEYLVAELDNNAVEIADALTDLHYIGAGTFCVYGIDGEACFEHVHQTNMAKLGPDGKAIRRDDGKILKPEGWQPPNLAPIVFKNTSS
jgi:hypothetical protein